MIHAIVSVIWFILAAVFSIKMENTEAALGCLIMSRLYWIELKLENK